MNVRRAAVLLLLLFIASIASAQIPTPEEFLGYRLGERFTSYDQILSYFHELTRHSPLITVQQFGETYEHRPLVLAVSTAPKNPGPPDPSRPHLVAPGGAATRR